MLFGFDLSFDKRSHVFSNIFFYQSIVITTTNKIGIPKRNCYWIVPIQRKKNKTKMRNKAKKNSPIECSFEERKKVQNNHHFNIIGYFTNDYDLYWCINELHSIGKDTYILVRTPKEKKTHTKNSKQTWARAHSSISTKHIVRTFTSTITTANKGSIRVQRATASFTCAAHDGNWLIQMICL